MTIKTKEEIRKHFRKIRANLSEKRKEEAKSNALQVLTKIVQNYNNILSFTSKKEEIDLSQLNILLSKEKHLYLPKAAFPFLKIYKVTDLSSLIMNDRYFILEPDPEKCKLVDPEIIDLALIPGVAFDNENNRIGFGKAYYDTLLAKMPHTTKIGIGFKEQLSQQHLPVEKHDVQLNDIYLF